MEPIDTAAPPAQVQDRTLATSVSLVALCPNMDLVAVVLHANAVAIFRASWHRLATIPVVTDPHQAITALAWSPTGANLVVATSDPQLFIHSVDRAASAPPARARRNPGENDPVAQLSLPLPATALCWAPAPPASAHYDDRASALYAEPPDSVGEKGLLFVGDRDANLSIYTSNLKFTIARTRLLSRGFFVDRIFLTRSLSHCMVAGYPATLLDDEPADHAVVSSTVAMRCANLAPLLEHWRELERMSREVVAVKALMARFADTEGLIRESWADGALGVLESSVVQPLQKQLAQFGEAGSIWLALYDIFCGARVAGAALQFLGTDLSVNGAKEVLRLFRAHVTDVRLGVAALVPLSEQALARASEFRGLTRLTDRFAPIGCLFGDADALVQAVEALCFRLDEFATEVEKMAAMTEAFLAWVVLTASKAGGESMQGRVPAAVDEMDPHDMGLVFSFFQLMTEPGRGDDDDAAVLREHFTGAKFTHEVLPALRDFRGACEQAIGRPAQTIAPRIELSGGIELPLKVLRVPGSSVRKCYMRQTCGGGSDGEGDVTVLESVLTTAGGRLVCVAFNAAAGSWSVAQKCLDAVGGRVEDVAHVGDGEVLLAVSGRGDGDGDDGMGEASEGEAGGDGVEKRRRCELVRYAVGECGLWDDEVVVHGEQTMASVAVPEASVLGGEPSCRSDVAVVGHKGRIHVSLNAASGLLSVLVEPRRLVLLQLQRGNKANNNSNDMSPS